MLATIYCKLPLFQRRSKHLTCITLFHLHNMIRYLLLTSLFYRWWNLSSTRSNDTLGNRASTVAKWAQTPYTSYVFSELSGLACSAHCFLNRIPAEWMLAQRSASQWRQALQQASTFAEYLRWMEGSRHREVESIYTISNISVLK